MKTRTYTVCILSFLLGISISVMGCSKNEKTNAKKTEQKTINITEPKESESMVGIDKTDGNLVYPTPEGYRTKRSDVEYGKVVTVQYESTTVGKMRDVTIVLPAGYTEDKKYPVLYLCHGLGQDNTQWINEGHVEITIGNMIANGKSKEMILVLPNCRARMNDAANPSDVFAITNYQAFDNFMNDFKKDLQPFIESNYSVANGRDNTAIVGFSMGGRVALHLGFSLQDTFGYIGAFCPAPGIFGYSMMGVTEEGLFKKAEFTIKEEYKDHTYVMIVAGKSDQVVGNYPESYHDALVENNVVHTWFTVTGGHDFEVCNHGLYIFAEHLFGK